MGSLDRRSFLKLASAGMIAPFGGPIIDGADFPALPDSLGRVTQPRLSIYEAPDPQSAIIGTLRRDMIVPIFEEVDTVGLLSHNPRWFRIRTGWVYSSWLQPVRDTRQRYVVQSVPDEGFWAQVSVPFSDAYTQPVNDAATSRFTYRLYYSTVHRIVGAQQDERSRWWYEIQDDYFTTFRHFVRADHLRPIAASEMSPLSPDVEDKVIKIDIGEQRVYALENDVEVYSARCATGTYFTIEELGGLVNFTTPTGWHTVVRKRPSRHMIGGQGRADEYDLPGVPFCTYFTQPGAAIHGAYWHNDYGHPRSHGCVNVLAEDALWFYRWSSPATPYAEPLVLVSTGGTSIFVS